MNFRDHQRIACNSSIYFWVESIEASDYLNFGVYQISRPRRNFNYRLGSAGFQEFDEMTDHDRSILRTAYGFYCWKVIRVGGCLHALAQKGKTVSGKTVSET
jgi:hypothetical protein